MFGDHSSCSSSFCKYVDEATEVPVDDDQSEEEFMQQQEDQEPTTLLGHLNRIAEAETEVEPTPEDELAALSGYTRSLSELPDGLYRKVMTCGDRLVMLAPQLISNLTSNLAKCYMGLRAICDGGKQYNRIQSGSFEHRCYAAGLQAQHDPQWGVKFWKGLTGEEPNQVCYCVPLLKYSTISSAIFNFYLQIVQAAADKHSRQQQKDKERKQKPTYQEMRRSARYSTGDKAAQQHYGSLSQQPDVSPSELTTLCAEYYEREVLSIVMKLNK